LYFAPRDPAQAGIARCKAESARPRPAATGLRPLDRVARSEPTATGWTTSPAVWEWTNSCFVRISLDGERERITNTNCGVRVVEGAHRSYMTDFIRDPRSGGCAAGVPPANLGFRLVAEPSQSVATSVVRNVTKLLRRT
jgi:hypothetical protein